MRLFEKLFSILRKNRKTDEISEYEFSRINRLATKLKIQPIKPIYFAKALTHRSYLEKKTALRKSNERLEFLGDAVLGVIVAESLFSKFPDEDEGFLTKTRSHMVDKNALFESAELLGLKQYLFYDKRFIKDSEAGLKTILADCMEALIGAIYLDQGIETAEEFISKWILNPNLESGKYQIDNNYKGQLLEYTHAKKMLPPEYVLVSSEGPDHKKEFIVEVKIDNITYCIGKGRNKKSAEQEAAQKTLHNLRD
jgi:ribonuclease-3